MYKYDTYTHIGMNGNQISIESVRRRVHSNPMNRISGNEYDFISIRLLFFWFFVCFSIKYLLIVFVWQCVIVCTEPFERSSHVMIVLCVSDNVLVNGMSNGRCRWVIIIKSEQIEQDR